MEKQQQQERHYRSASNTTTATAVIGGLEIAYSLLQKDRLDARILGMESLVILTDPRKSTMDTCRIASQAVLQGSSTSGMFQFLQDFVLTILQKKQMINEDEILDGMAVDYDSDDEDYWDVMRPSASTQQQQQQQQQYNADKPPEYKDCLWTMEHLALRILANAWEVTTCFANDDEPEVTSNSHNNNATAAIVDHFHEKCMNLTQTDILFTLLESIGNHGQPHHAHTTLLHNTALACKSLRLLCQASNAARQRTMSLGGLARATHSHDIGVALHARLEHEAHLLVRTLQAAGGE